MKKKNPKHILQLWDFYFIFLDWQALTTCGLSFIAVSNACKSHTDFEADLYFSFSFLCLTVKFRLFFSPCLYDKTYRKVLQTTFCCQWYLEQLYFLWFTDSDIRALNCAWSSRCGMPPPTWKVWKCSVEMKHGELELQVTLPSLW